MIQKMSNEKNIDFIDQALGKTTEPEPETTNKAAEVTPEKIEPAKHLDNRSMVSRGGGKVASATAGAITNMGGPKKHIGSDTQNSIWDSGLVEKLSQTPDSKERVTEEKAENERLRKSMKKERLDEMVESLQDTDLRKGSNVASMASHSGSNYNSPRNAISIFDSGDFDRVPEQTDGEKMAEEARKPKEADDSWKENSGPKNLHNALNKLFD